MNRDRWIIVGAFALLVLLAAACLVAMFKIDIAPAVMKKKGPVRTQNFGEGIRFTQKGLMGIDLVSIGRAHMRKLRKGPFMIGAINELVLEDVALALPEEVWNADAAAPGDAAARRVNKDIASISSTRQAAASPSSASPSSASPSSASPSSASPSERGTAAKRTLAALGINPGHIKMGEKIPRFSALAIRNLAPRSARALTRSPPHLTSTPPSSHLFTIFLKFHPHTVNDF